MLMNNERGFSIIEVMVAIVIMSVGLIGLAGLQARAITAQKEAYQRSQALILARDMADRILANRTEAGFTTSYRIDPDAGDTPRGTGFGAATSCTGMVGAARDLCEWHNSLLGASTGGTISLIGARGCIYELSTTLPKTLVVTIAWQGYSPTATPAISCGAGSYGGNDALRRTATLPVTLPTLD